jgi:hypothetical protein
MTTVVQRLDKRARAPLLAHFLALAPEDRRLRFGSSLSAGAIAQYVGRIDFERDAAFGVYDMSLAWWVSLTPPSLTTTPSSALRAARAPPPRCRERVVRARRGPRAQSFGPPALYALPPENAAIVHIAKNSTCASWSKKAKRTRTSSFRPLPQAPSPANS